VTCVWACDTSSGEIAETRMLPTWVPSWLIMQDLKVTQGITTRSSWSWPCEDCPLPSRTPTTWHGMALTRTTRPSGSPAPKSFVATVWPSTQTLAPESDSLSLKNRPCAIVHSRMAKKSGVEPKTVVSQF
jgi:hypothetical protein